MEYILWVIVGLLGYSIVAPITSFVTEDVPPTAGLFLATAVFLVVTSAVILFVGVPELRYVVSTEAMYIYLAGLFLTIGILSYTKALEFGPVSVVVPIFGMFIVGSSVLGILFLNEQLTVSRLGGIICASLSIYLSSLER